MFIPDRAPSSRSRWRGWLAGLGSLVFLVLAAWAMGEDRTLPPAVPASAPDMAFSSGRAMAQLREIAREPRPVGSPEHTRVRELILERLGELGVEPDVQTGVFVRRAADDATAVTLRNVIARIPGTDPSGTIALVAHYDGVASSPAAGDNGVGVVVVLEVVRALLAGPSLENDVIVLFPDGEEIGLLGARLFAAEHPWMEDVRVVLNMDMRGAGGVSHMFETGAENGWVVRAMRAADPHPKASSASIEVYRRMPNDSDFSVFRQAGVQGLNFAAIGRPWAYHQPTDTPANVQEETVQHKGARVLAITRALAGRDLSSVDAPDLAFIDLPVVGLVTHPLGWVLPISGVVLVLWIAITVLAIARGGRWTGIPAGLAVVVLAGIGAVGLGWALMAWLPRFHPEHGTILTAFYGERWYMLGLTAGVVALVTALLALARRWFPVATLAAGAVSVPVLVALALAFVAPLAAIELQIPAFAGVLAVGVVVLAGDVDRDRPMSVAGRIAALLLALPALAVLVPLTQGLWLAMSFAVAPALGVLVVLGLATLVPALDGLGTPGRWWAPAAAALGCVAFVAAGVLQAGPSPDRPVHSTLLYTLDRESGEALWATRDDAGFEWAQRQVGPFADERPLTPFLISAPFHVAPAPAAEIPRVEVQLEGVAAGAGDGATHRVRVRSVAGAEVVYVVLDGVDGAGFVAVQGEAIPPGPAGEEWVARVTHRGVPAGGDVILDLHLPDGVDEVPIIVIEEYYRAASFLGEAPFERPPHLMPRAFYRSDRALVRDRVVLPAM